MGPECECNLPIFQQELVVHLCNLTVLLHLLHFYLASWKLLAAAEKFERKNVRREYNYFAKKLLPCSLGIASMIGFDDDEIICGWVNDKFSRRISQGNDALIENLPQFLDSHNTTSWISKIKEESD